MRVQVLVLDNFADVYASHLRQEFPQLTVHAAKRIADINVPLAAMDVLVAFGIAINDKLLADMSGLKWIQSLATGTDHFTNSPAFRNFRVASAPRAPHVGAYFAGSGPLPHLFRIAANICAV